MIFDSHCHLDAEVYGSDEAVDDVVRTARAAGVSRMLTIGCCDGTGKGRRAVAVAERHEGVWAAVGVHPHDASRLDEALLDELEALLSHPKVRAWGELGLDFFYDLSPREQQREALRRQLRRAVALGVPVIVHDRDSLGETARILDEEGAFERCRVLYHCFSGDLAHMEELVARGAWISIPGVVTYKKATEMQEVARRIPAPKILVETDSPYLTPEPLRGRRNEPCHVALTVDAVALLRGVARDELARTTTANACAFLGLDA